MHEPDPTFLMGLQTTLSDHTKDSFGRHPVQCRNLFGCQPIVKRRYQTSRHDEEPLSTGQYLR
jgi:hypothetical protein